ncbi:MAG: Maf family protein, partial [Bdellovibrionales bacterium]|nr:Maf family protein [Bdellovibrionales bacterium]
RILGKPKNSAEAQSFLHELSLKTHSVITGVCVYDVDSCRYVVASDETLVRFRKLSENEISEYVSSGEPMDKAGGYGIQGMAGRFVDKTEGSYSNVVGLPMELFEKMVNENGWRIDRR